MSNEDLNNESILIEQIKNFNQQDFKTITEASIIFLISKNKLDRLEILNKTLIQINDCKQISKWILKQLTLAQSQNIDPAKLIKHFQSNYALDEQKTLIIKSLWEKYWNDLNESNNNKNELMISKLVDMEWKFGVTASTNYIDKLGSAFLQLKLVYNNGHRLESKFMELTLPQFYSFLLEMNKAKSQMEYLS